VRKEIDSTVNEFSTKRGKMQMTDYMKAFREVAKNTPLGPGFDVVGGIGFSTVELIMLKTFMASTVNKKEFWISLGVGSLFGSTVSKAYKNWIKEEKKANGVTTTARKYQNVLKERMTDNLGSSPKAKEIKQMINRGINIPKKAYKKSEVKNILKRGK